MKKIAGIIVTLLVLGAAYGFYLYNKPVSSIENQTAFKEISADQLVSEFDNDETMANSLYLDKVVMVTGEVEKVIVKENTTSVYLSTNNMMSSIICELEPDLKQNLKKGDRVKIKGVCSGFLMDVVLVRSVIVK